MLTLDIETNREKRVQAWQAWLKRQMETHRLRPADVATALGVHVNTFNRWANGSHAPEPDTCIRMAKALRTDPQEVLEASGWIPTMTDEREALAQLVRYLTEDQVRDARQFIRFLIQRSE